MKSTVHHAALWRAPLPGVHAVLMRSDRGFGRHWHDSHGFGVMEQGAHRSASGRGPVLASAGQIVTVNPGEVHDGQPLDGQARHWRMVYLAPAQMAALVGRENLEFTRPVLDDPPLRHAIEHLFHVWAALPANGGVAAASAWEEALAQAAGLLLQRHGHRRLADDTGAPLARVCECLLDRLDDPPTLGELAALAGLSRFQLVRQFARAHGLPPFAWLQQHRLRRARGLIASGLPLSEAAQACGYADQSHLHRHFVRSLGFTPGAWQRASGRPLQ